MSRKDAKNAEMPESRLSRRQGQCMMPYVLLAEKNAKFPLSLRKADLFIAVNVLQNKTNSKKYPILRNALKRAFFSFYTIQKTINIV